MLKNKGGLKLAVLSVVALFGLTACDSEEIYSKPTDYESPIVKIDGEGSDVHNNVLSIIYDAMHEGNLSSNTLDKILYNYASSIFGFYNGVALPEGSEVITLKEAVTSYDEEHDTNTDKINTFIKDHKVYWNYNEEGEHVDDNGAVVDDETFTPCKAERQHVVSKWNAIEERIAESMYKSATASNYVEKNYYNEKEFLRSLYEAGHKVATYADKNFEQFIIPYTVEEKEAFDEIVGYDNANHVILHRAYYQSTVNNDADESATYIEDEILPSIYNDLLIEQYLLDEDVAAVRNSRARKINVIKIEKYSSFTNNSDMLVKELVKEIYANVPAANGYLRTDAEQIEEEGDTLFRKYSIIAKGLYDQIQADADAVEIVNRLNLANSDVYELATYIDSNTTTYHYYKNTSYGDLLKDYIKVDGVNTWAGLDESKYSTFTSSGTRSVIEGLEQQTIDIMQKQNITKGWYIQSKTPSLDSNGTINDRLFKLSIANNKLELKDETSDEYETLVERDRIVKDGNAWKVRDAASADENKFLCSINGAYYLKFDGKSSEESWTKDIVYDDGSAYYIVQVLEAAKDSKLRNVSSSNYALTRGQTVMDEIIDNIAKIVGETGSYSTLSRNHWLEKMAIQYHDQAIYDYFKSNYPDLFEDD